LIISDGSRLVLAKHWKSNTGHIVHTGTHSKSCRHGPFGNLLLKVTRSILGLRQRKEGSRTIGGHAGLGFGNAFGIVTEFDLQQEETMSETKQWNGRRSSIIQQLTQHNTTHLQCICLLFQKFVSTFCSLQLSLEDLLVHTCGRYLGHGELGLIY
jgi:hypothetical protein